MKLKHVVLVKFLSKQMNLQDILGDQMLNYRLSVLKSNLIQSLNN